MTFCLKQGRTGISCLVLCYCFCYCYLLRYNLRVQVNASDSRGKADAKIVKGIGGSTANSIKELVSNESLSYKKEWLALHDPMQISLYNRPLPHILVLLLTNTLQVKASKICTNNG